MEETLYNDLKSLSYGDETFSVDSFRKLIHQGLETVEFSRVVQTLCKQIRLFTHLQQEVDAMRSPADASSFLMDMSSFLEELDCPYQQLISVPLEERLATPQNRLLLIDFLIGELQAARLNYVNHGPEPR